jgi:hypothetical protein
MTDLHWADQLVYVMFGIIIGLGIAVILMVLSDRCTPPLFFGS